MNKYLWTLALALPVVGACSSNLSVDTAAPGPEALVEAGRLEVTGPLTSQPLVVSASAMDRYEALASAKPAAPAGEPFAEGGHLPSQAEPLHKGVSTDFSLSLDLPRTDYVLGEPVIARVTLTNTSDQPQEIAPLLDPVFDRFKVTITGPDGASREFRPTVTACTLPKVAIRTLQPGQTWTHDVNLFASKSGWAYTLSGEYTLQATLLGMTEAGARVVAEPIELTMLDGTPSEQAAARLVTQGEAAVLLDWNSGDQFVAGRQTLETVARSYPDSIHAIYASYVLGNMAATEFAGTYGVRAADPAQAIEWLAPVHARLSAAGAPVMAPKIVGDVANLLAGAYAQAGKVDLARQTLTTFIGDHAGDAAYADYVASARETLASL